MKKVIAFETVIARSAATKQSAPIPLTLPTKKQQNSIHDPSARPNGLLLQKQTQIPLLAGRWGR